ncbi:hypothetical protein KCTC52924_03037 [Arenibacter antarcticus]
MPGGMEGDVFVNTGKHAPTEELEVHMGTVTEAFEYSVIGTSAFP